jgi:mRNA-degrading endonuclease RelE of RelBE toxin-antitoxin system
VKERIRKRVVELAIEPHVGLRLAGDLAEFWKDRVGDYRILYKIEEASHKIIFYDVDLRKRIYD